MQLPIMQANISGKSDLLFQFLSINSNANASSQGCHHFGLAAVFKTEWAATLAQVQVNAMNYWMDRLRHASADHCEGAVRSLPTSWFNPEIVRTLSIVCSIRYRYQYQYCFSFRHCNAPPLPLHLWFILEFRLIQNCDYKLSTGGLPLTPLRPWPLTSQMRPRMRQAFAPVLCKTSKSLWLAAWSSSIQHATMTWRKAWRQ